MSSSASAKEPAPEPPVEEGILPGSLAEFGSEEISPAPESLESGGLGENMETPMADAMQSLDSPSAEYSVGATDFPNLNAPGVPSIAIETEPVEEIE